MVTVNMQAEMTVIKEKLVNFVNGIREEAESIYLKILLQEFILVNRFCLLSDTVYKVD